MTPQLRSKLIRYGLIAGAFIVLSGIAAYYILSASRVYVDSATITAPLIELAPTAPGTLTATYVKEGDYVAANTPVALVGSQVLTTNVAGIITKVNDTQGAEINPGESVVTEIDPTTLKVIGKLDENKGLANVAVGDPVIFTVDAYGSREFKGMVDEVAPSSNQSDIVFNISDARQAQNFSIKVRYDHALYSYLKNGMSARLWIYRR